ncbi:hypothetical protein, partial [Maribellus sp. YY47]|uniref:hypothetical protein n=1 Tax=Maribellus sp. YY47 TaxID=2929486 RepID=UPI002001894D
MEWIDLAPNTLLCGFVTINTTNDMKTTLPKRNLTRTRILGMVFKSSLSNFLFLLLLLLASVPLQSKAQSYFELLESNLCQPADPTVNCTANSADVVGAYIALEDGTKITDDNIPSGNHNAYVFLNVVKIGNKYDLYAQFDLVIYNATTGQKTSDFIQAFAGGTIQTGDYRIYQEIPNYIVNGEINSLVGIENMIVGWDNTDNNTPTCLTGNYSACNAQIPDIIAQGPFIVVPQSDEINCNGETTSVEFIVSGGKAPYSITFNGETKNTTSTVVFENVSAGSLYYEASDSDGHFDDGTLVITEPMAIEANPTVTTPIDCSGETATIALNGSGGTSPLTYTLTSDGRSNETGIFSDVPAGAGQIYTITDANDCYFEGTFDVTPGDGEAPTGTAPDGTTGINACYIDEFTPPVGTPVFDAIAVASNYSDPGGVTAELTNTSVTGTNCSWEVIYTFRVFDNCSNELINQQIVHSGSDQDPATGITPSGVANINACASETEIDGLYPTANDEAAIEAAYSDDCGTVTAAFVSQTLTGGQCNWTLVRTYNIFDGCAANDFTVEMTYSGSDQDPAIGITPSGVANINACANETEIDGLYPTADDEAAIEAAYSDDCGTVTAAFVSQTLTGGQCNWTLVRTYNISDGCAANDFTVEMTYSGSDQDPATGITPSGVANINACANETEIDGLYPTEDDEAAIETAYSDDCGTVTASFVSQILTGGQCNWTLVRTYNISDGCSANDFTVEMTYSGSDQDPATGITASGVANINACANETEIDGLYPTADDEAAIEAAYSDDCGTVTAAFVSQTLTGGQCNWTLVRTYNISDGCAANDFTVEMTYSGSDQDPATGITPSGVANINACANETEIDELYPTEDDEAAIEAAYSDDCGTVTASFVSQTLTGGQCNWTLVRTYNISDGCAANDFTVEMTYSGSDQDPATGITPS